MSFKRPEEKCTLIEIATFLILFFVGNGHGGPNAYRMFIRLTSDERGRIGEFIHILSASSWSCKVLGSNPSRNSQIGQPGVLTNFASLPEFSGPAGFWAGRGGRFVQKPGRRGIPSGEVPLG